MPAQVCDVLLTEEPLALPENALAAETGALVDFWGVVRKTEGEEELSGIEYEAHRAMAEHQLRALAEEAARQFDLSLVLVQHRLGFVPVEEASLLVRVGSRHRAAAFRGSVWIVDELKKRAPIWKHPRVACAAEGKISSAA